MKEQILKRGIPLFLAAVMVMAGVGLADHPGKSEAAAKTTYNVVVQKDSPLVTLVSIKNGASTPMVSSNEGITFQKQVEAKLKTETVKIGGTKVKASYYPVTIIAKSYKAPTSKFPVPGA